MIGTAMPTDAARPPGPPPIEGFDHYYATGPDEGTWFAKPIRAVIDAQVSDHHGVETIALLDQHGLPASTDLTDWVRAHMDQVLLSLLIGAPRHVEQHRRTILHQLRADVDPFELRDDMDDLIEALRMPTEAERTLQRMHVFVHEDGSASGGSTVLDRPAELPEDSDPRGELGRAHLARGLLDRLASDQPT